MTQSGYAAIVAQNMQHAADAYARRDLQRAEQYAQAALAMQPDDGDALTLLGIIAAQTGRKQEGLGLLTRVAQAQPNDASAHSNLGSLLRELGRFDEALLSLNRAIKLAPKHVDALSNRGTVLQELGRREDALKNFDQVIRLQPNHVQAHINRCVVLNQLGHTEQALRSVDRALALQPGNPLALNNRGRTLVNLGRREDALTCYQKVLEVAPNYFEAWLNQGVALKTLRRFDEAIRSYQQALQLKADYAEAHLNVGNCQQEMRRYEASLQSYDHAIQINPRYAEAYVNRGATLHAMGEAEAALAHFQKAVELRPDLAEVHIFCGYIFTLQKRFEEAYSHLDTAFSLQPEFDYLYGRWMQIKVQLCDWRDMDKHRSAFLAKVERRKKTTNPLPVVYVTDDRHLQRLASEIWVNETYPANNILPVIPRRARNEKIRIGYFSMDYLLHPVAQLTAELFEVHDRSRFEVFAFSYGLDTQDVMRRRLETAFDQFIDVRTKADTEIAQLARDMQLDIAIDLAGHTGSARTGIFALRAAHVQVNYLGFPATMAAPYIDYLIADKTVIPEVHRDSYAEKIVYLPAFQVNDRTRVISERVFTREECGLPREGFVFCCYNNSYKILPEMFSIWMNILRQVEGSVLWLPEESAAMRSNLCKEAQARGINVGRLVFGQRLPSAADYLARFRTADLFLDTLPYNAHTTASDALWAGLPLLTCAGNAYASRVAASVLLAAGLPELITQDLPTYEKRAIELATHPGELQQLRQRLQANRNTMLLFDTPRFARHIESAYEAMIERWHNNESPDHIDATQ